MIEKVYLPVGEAPASFHLTPGVETAISSWVLLLVCRLIPMMAPGSVVNNVTPLLATIIPVFMLLPKILLTKLFRQAVNPVRLHQVADNVWLPVWVTRSDHPLRCTLFPDPA